MAIYRGVNGVARNITEEWRGIDGVARNITEEWRGIDGVARLVFGSGFDLLSHIEIDELNNSGGSTVVDSTVNKTTLKIEATSGDDGAEEYDWIQYVILGLNAGDVLEIEYDFSFDNVVGYYVLAHESGIYNASGAVWENTNANKNVGTRSYSQTATIPDGSTAFIHRLMVVGNYDISASINVTSIKLNGEQIFPIS